MDFSANFCEFLIFQVTVDDQISNHVRVWASSPTKNVRVALKIGLHGTLQLPFHVGWRIDLC